MLLALRKPGDLDRAELFLRSLVLQGLQVTRNRLPVRDLDLGALGAQPIAAMHLISFMFFNLDTNSVSQPVSQIVSQIFE
jgi:hypothetical protein